MESSQKKGQLLKRILSLGAWEDPPAEPAMSRALPARSYNALGIKKDPK